jgi:energy-converting hydrogenase Eha subunit C
MLLDDGCEVVASPYHDIVFALLKSGAVNVSAACFPLNVVQSAEERNPGTDPDAFCPFV